MTTHENGNAALITGASSGIGKAFTKVFAEEGYDIVMVARSEDRLRRIANDLESNFGVSTLPITQDLAIPDAPEQVYETVRGEDINVDVLVNNAGIAGTYGPFHETDVEDELTMTQLNMITLTHLTKLFIGEMVERGDGKVLNVASTAAFNPGPFMAVYHATKSYVLVFSEAIAEELRGTGVTVTVLCPGRTRTGFLEHSGIEESEANKQEAMDPETVAKAGYRGLVKGRTVVFPDRKQKFMSVVTQLLPRSAVRRVAMRRERSRDRSPIMD